VFECMHIYICVCVCVCVCVYTFVHSFIKHSVNPFTRSNNLKDIEFVILLV